ncbi:MAG: hypothetical protein A3J65_01325 [Candidatus Buchananbacteria bacterium RIFCSPHIGHO2_02_FULL_45_11b]|uniref:Uncharacterized protein n=3 Tax=Candidatus Buchananiibacteriota TaxID=1817903 RepID=A0A1G1YBM9_9BACT|nr:MAG: hypothetical protein A2663_04380 [Candidatus Buchananbacteria bacterium RIFCSPHIGHO2_01_FULL_46_12]OGY50026.1 MAG: hypothetical protein A3J65_01325 [Candidatus Buchananbacteria bacterium RIFCSPHIGHO2_02_FULL_45_11b]OGY56652.1 MAG: hypothetical protein A3H67_00430 [Candidatus Buchananbacteria bacterium RIFCSPLOWO2_02_FULL_46_11b]
MTQNPNELGALWVNDPKNDRSPVLTGTVNGQRVSVFKNKRWSQEEKKKQPIYQILKSTIGAKQA